MILAALLSLPIAFASAPDLTLLTSEADRVVRGEVLTTRTQREKDNAFTVATVRVLETLRGQARPVLEVRMPGASLANHDLTVHGGPRLIAGHEVLLFLDGYRLVDMRSGAFVIKDGAAWRGEHAWTWADPETVGDHRNDHYVSVDIDELKGLIQ
jgi:hypothetical protein